MRLAVFLLIGIGIVTADLRAEKLTLGKTRVRITGHNFNRPDPFPGRGKFTWAGNVARLKNGNLLFVHNGGYYHVSFAEPRDIAPELRRRYLAEGWPLDRKAPTGGRTMGSISKDNGKTWSKPTKIVDLPLDDCGYGLLKAKDGTLLCFINIQASWYGYKRAPKQFRKSMIGGLNSQQCVIRSTDDGKTWSKPIFPKSPGDFYQRSHAQPIMLPNGTILWATYCIDTKHKGEFGVVHESTDHGKTWKVRSVVKRRSEIVDEPAIVHLGNGRLVMVCRPDGGVFRSVDAGKTWKEATAIAKSRDRLKAPRLFALKDRTVVCVCTFRGRLQVIIGRDGGRRWSKPMMIDPGCYGYPGGIKLADESMLITYNSSGRAPNMAYAVRIKVNERRNGYQFLKVGE